MANAVEENQPTEPQFRDTSLYTNLYIGSCETGEVSFLKFLFAKELYGKKELLKVLDKWFCFDLGNLIWTFLEVRLDVNFQNFRGETGLICAARRGNVSVVNLLLRIPQTDVNLTDKSGMSALLHATRRSNSCVKLLLDFSGLDVNATDQSGWSSLMIASRKGRNVESFLKQPGIDPNIQDVGKRFTALILASKYGHPRVVEQLINHKSMDLSTVMGTGNTQLEEALLHAYEKNHAHIISILEED